VVHLYDMYVILQKAPPKCTVILAYGIDSLMNPNRINHYEC